MPIQYILATVSTEGTSHSDFTKVKTTRQLDINVESPTDTRGCWITDLAMLQGDLLLLTDYNNKSVKLADPTSGKLLDKLQLPGTPWGLCLLPGDRAAVTIPGKSTIQTISVTHKKLVLQNVINIKEKCCGIDSIKDLFVIGFNDPAKVALVDSQGKNYKAISDSDFQGKALFKYPDYICVTTENTRKVIYVSDRGTRTITRLSEELQVLQSFTDPALNDPRGLVSVGRGQLLVVNYGGFSLPSTLSVLDVTTGQFKPLLGREEKLHYIDCVAVIHPLGTVYVNHWAELCHVIRQYTFK